MGIKQQGQHSVQEFDFLQENTWKTLRVNPFPLDMQIGTRCACLALEISEDNLFCTIVF